MGMIWELSGGCSSLLTLRVTHSELEGAFVSGRQATRLSRITPDKPWGKLQVMHAGRGAMHAAGFCGSRCHQNVTGKLL